MFVVVSGQNVWNQPKRGFKCCSQCPSFIWNQMCLGNFITALERLNIWLVGWWFFGTHIFLMSQFWRKPIQIANKRHLNNLTVIHFSSLPPFLNLNISSNLLEKTPSWKVVSYNTAMGATATADAWQMTLELFQHDGTEGDQISYSSAMTCGRFRWRGVQIGGFCGKTTLEGTQLMIKK